MANSFSKQERNDFEAELDRFNDELVMSGLVARYDMGDVDAERGSDVTWRTIPYIAQSQTGLDQSGNFKDSVQLSVPAQLGDVYNSNWTMTAKEQRDGLQNSRKGQAARQKLSSDVNVVLMNRAANEGTVVVARSGAATGYDDVAEADAVFNERGIQMDERIMALSSRDYNGMASNLAARETMNQMPTEAYRRSYVGDVAGFETHKMDYANSLTAAAGTSVTINAATIGDRHYTPVSTQASGNGYNQTNVDNRYQTITIAVGGGTVKVGDAFTIAGVNSVHQITKNDTGTPMTFRIHEIVTGAGGSGTVKISPPIITNDDTTTAADEQYKNCSATPANGAALTFLNTTTASVNPFWRKGAIELLPANLVVEENSGIGVLRGTTDQGLTLIMTRQSSIDDLSAKYRYDTFFGTVVNQPQMVGIELFGQV